MFVASRWYAPWFPQGLPNKQETVGFVCRLSAPVVGHLTLRQDICAANMRMRRGRYASSRERCLRTYACMSMPWQNTRGGHMCRQCRASGVRPRQPGLFQVQLQVQVQGHVHREESRWALLNARSCPYYLTPLFW